MKIAGREISAGHSPYIIAEISCNHMGDISEAYRLMEAAKQAGADACKFQAYTADTITLDHDGPDFLIQDGPWKGRRLHDLYSRTQTPSHWFPPLFEYARKRGITVLSSVFDHSSVDMLEALDCPAYKIASFEITDIPLIKYAAKTGKPLIISTGMAGDAEIEDAIRAVEKNDENYEYALLSCVSGYPSTVAESNLRRLDSLKGWYYVPYCPKGISDHTLGWEVPVAATALGACIIEKHLILSRDSQSEDRDFSLTPAEFKHMVTAVRSIWRAMQPSEAKSEESSRQLRRSLVVRNVVKGEVFTDQNVRLIRPAYGLAPKYLEEILGQTASRDVQYGSALTWDMVEDHE